MDALQRVTELRKLESEAQARRAKAEANLALAKTRLEQTEAEIRSLGVEPENAEQELATLKAQLDKTVTELDAALRADLARCDEVIKTTTAALQ